MYITGAINIVVGQVYLLPSMHYHLTEDTVCLRPSAEYVVSEVRKEGFGRAASIVVVMQRVDNKDTLSIVLPNPLSQLSIFNYAKLLATATDS